MALFNYESITAKLNPYGKIHAPYTRVGQV